MTDRTAAVALGGAAGRFHRPAAREAAARLIAVAGPAAVSLLAFGHPHEAVPALLYVLAVLVATALGGRAPGLVAAVASIVPFYYFFVTPYHVWAIKADRARLLVIPVPFHVPPEYPERIMSVTEANGSVALP